MLLFRFRHRASGLAYGSVHKTSELDTRRDRDDGGAGGYALELDGSPRRSASDLHQAAGVTERSVARPGIHLERVDERGAE